MRDSFHIGVFGFHETWGASYLLMYANVVITHSMADAVSIHCSVRLCAVSFRIFNLAALYMWSLFNTFCRQHGLTATHIPLPMSEICPVTLVPSFILITCPLLHTSVSIYTDGLWSCSPKRQRHVHMDLYLMLWTGGSFLLALLLTRRCFVFRAVFFHI